MVPRIEYEYIDNYKYVQSGWAHCHEGIYVWEVLETHEANVFKDLERANRNQQLWESGLWTFSSFRKIGDIKYCTWMEWKPIYVIDDEMQKWEQSSEAERESIYIYIYTYIHVPRERERDRLVSSPSSIS